MRHAIPFVLALTAAASLTIMNARTHAAIGQDPELGLVRWTRDFDAALNQSKHSGKPLLVLFDEIPGCATCRGFGAQVLSYPLLVDAIESEFVPLPNSLNKARLNSRKAWPKLRPRNVI